MLVTTWLKFTKNFKKTTIFLVTTWLKSTKAVRDPFRNITKAKIFIDCTAGGKINKLFSEESCFEFWVGADNKFSVLKIRAFCILLLFLTSHFYETEFFGVAVLNT